MRSSSPQSVYSGSPLACVKNIGMTKLKKEQARKLKKRGLLKEKGKKMKMVRKTFIIHDHSLTYPSLSPPLPQAGGDSEQEEEEEGEDSEGSEEEEEEEGEEDEDEGENSEEEEQLEDEAEMTYNLRKRRPVIYQYQPVIQACLIPYIQA